MTTKMYNISKKIATAIFKRFYNAQVIGLENIPDEPAILALNQSSTRDVPVFCANVLDEINRPIFFVYRKIDILFPINLYLERLGYVGIKSESLTTFRDFKRKAMGVLESGAHLGICPEGKRIKKKKLGKFYCGAAHVSIESRRLIVPIYMTDLYCTPLRKNISIQIGKPISPEGRNPKRLTWIVREAILEMSDYE